MVDSLALPLLLSRVRLDLGAVGWGLRTSEASAVDTEEGPGEAGSRSAVFPLSLFCLAALTRALERSGLDSDVEEACWVLAERELVPASGLFDSVMSI